MTSRVSFPLWVVVLAALIFALTVIIIWSVKRKGGPKMKFSSDANLDDLRRSIAGMTHGTILEGNRVELFQNGAFWDRVFEDLGAAQKSIHFETFLAKPGVLSSKMFDLLAAKAAAGLEVRVMFDGNGSRSVKKEDIERMTQAGVRVQKYHRLRPATLGVLNNRDHRKIIIADGRIGFVGGHCLTDQWTGNAQDKEHCRDISARVLGPVVAQLQSAFAENWVEETGAVIGGPEYFPQLEAQGDTAAHAVWITPAGSPSSVKILHYMLIRAACKRITIQNPYFLPDPAACDALIEAVKRGVEVRVMIPAATASDSPLVQHASHHRYGMLLGGGVRLFDYQPTLLHQKVMSIDGCWALVGSTNFDDRSFEVNDEITLMTYDESIAGELEAIFEKDLASTVEVQFESWQRRPFLHKLKDFCFFLFNEQL